MKREKIARGRMVLYYLTFVVKTSYVRSFQGHLFSSLQKHSLSSNESPALECSWGGGGGGHFILKRQRCLSEILKRTPERWGLKCFLLWTLIENYIRPEIQANYGEVHIQTDCLFSACHFYFSAPPKKVWLITQFPILHILFHCFEFRIVISVSSVARVP